MKPSQRRQPTHMDKIYELQHLNAHFTRLWNEKTTIDNKTPRSFYLNPRSTHYIGRNGGRSKSADGRLKSSNLDLHRRVMSAKRKLDMRRTEFAPVDNLTGTLLAKRYERRYLQPDIMEKNFYYFAQPERAFEPRTLLTNFAQSKVVKSRNYQPPILHRRSRFFDFMNAKDKLNATWNGQLKKSDNLWTASPEPPLARSLSPTGSLFRDRISPNLLKYSPRMSTVTTRTRSALSRKSPHRKEEEELKYYQFVQEVTKDIIDRGVYSDRVLKSILAHHMERRRDDLNMTRMRQLLAKLLDDLGVSQEGLFSTHAEKASHPENVHFDPESFAREEENRRKEWTATDALQVEQEAHNTRNIRATLERAHKIETSDQFEEMDNASRASDVPSFDDQDIDDILEGRNLDQIMARRAAKFGTHKKNGESPTRERSIVQSSSSAVKSSRTANGKSDQSERSESDATPSQYESGQSDEEDTLGDEVSDLEEDDAVMKKSQRSKGEYDATSSSSTFTSQADESSSSSSSSSESAKNTKLRENRLVKPQRKTAVGPPPKRIIVANSNLPPVKKLSQQSRISSQDSIHIDAAPPKKLSNDSDAEMFVKPTKVPLPMNEFPDENVSIRTPSIDDEEEEDEENYSEDGSSVGSEIESEESEALERKYKGRDGHSSEEVEEDDENGHAEEQLMPKRSPATAVAQRHTATEKKIASNKANATSSTDKEVHKDNNRAKANRDALQSNEQQTAKTEEEERKPLVTEPTNQFMERRISGASDGSHPLSDGKLSPDRDLLRQRRDSFLKQLEQQQQDEKHESEEENANEGEGRSRIGSEQVDDPPFGPSPTEEVNRGSPPLAGERDHASSGEYSPKASENLDDHPVSPLSEIPKAPPRRKDTSSHPENEQSHSADEIHVKESGGDDQPLQNDVSSARSEASPKHSHDEEEEVAAQSDTGQSPSRSPHAEAEGTGSDNAFESESKAENDSSGSDGGDGSADIYSKDPTGNAFDESDSYYPPLSPITELPETPARKEMEALHGTMDSTNRSLKQTTSFQEPLRPLQKPPIPAPRRVSNASHGSNEGGDDRAGGGDRRASNASVISSASDKVNAIESQAH